VLGSVICIGQQKVADKSNEIIAIPDVLDKLEITDPTVSIDAKRYQSDIADKIVSKGADYLLAVKLKQKSLAEQIQEAFVYTKQVNHDEHWDYGHGRYETRSCTTNMKLLRKIALQIVKRYSDKSSMKKRRFRASLIANYLTQLLIT